MLPLDAKNIRNIEKFRGVGNSPAFFQTYTRDMHPKSQENLHTNTVPGSAAVHSYKISCSGELELKLRIKSNKILYTLLQHLKSS